MWGRLFATSWALCSAQRCAVSLPSGVADRVIATSVPAIVAGEIVMYSACVTWLSVSLHVGSQKAIALGFISFLAGGAFKAAIPAALLASAWKLLRGAERGRRSTAGNWRRTSGDEVSSKRRVARDRGTPREDSLGCGCGDHASLVD